MEAIDKPTNLPVKRSTTYEDLLEEIIWQITKYDIEVTQLDDPGCIRLEVTANKADHGRIIGKQGSTIGALHKLFTVIAKGKPVKIDLREDVEGRDQQAPESNREV